MKKLFVFALLVAGISAANAQEKTDAAKKERKGDKKEAKSATATHEQKAEKKDAKAVDKKDKAAK